MRLKNKKTGEIGYLIVGKGSDHYVVANDGWDSCGKYDSLAELNKEWEDCEEPKEYWFINDLDRTPMKCELRSSSYRDFAVWIEKRKQIGNYFDTREEAEKAVEKLKAWKRLKDRGFKLSAVVDTFFCLDIFMKGEPYEAIKDDLKIVFGGEE